MESKWKTSGQQIPSPEVTNTRFKDGYIPGKGKLSKRFEAKIRYVCKYVGLGRGDGNGGAEKQKRKRWPQIGTILVLDKRLDAA